jgi:hypothetical protein
VACGTGVVDIPACHKLKVVDGARLSSRQHLVERGGDIEVAGVARVCAHGLNPDGLGHLNPATYSRDLDGLLLRLVRVARERRCVGDSVLAVMGSPLIKVSAMWLNEVS